MSRTFEEYRDQYQMQLIVDQGLEMQVVFGHKDGKTIVWCPNGASKDFFASSIQIYVGMHYEELEYIVWASETWMAVSTKEEFESHTEETWVPARNRPDRKEALWIVFETKTSFQTGNYIIKRHEGLEKFDGAIIGFDADDPYTKEELFQKADQDPKRPRGRFTNMLPLENPGMPDEITARNMVYSIPPEAKANIPPSFWNTLMQVAEVCFAPEIMPMEGSR